MGVSIPYKRVTNSVFICRHYYASYVSIPYKRVTNSHLDKPPLVGVEVSIPYKRVTNGMIMGYYPIELEFQSPISGSQT